MVKQIVVHARPPSRRPEFLSQYPTNSQVMPRLLAWDHSQKTTDQHPTLRLHPVQQSLQSLRGKIYLSNSLILCPPSLTSMLWSEIPGSLTHVPRGSGYLCNDISACKVQLGAGCFLNGLCSDPSYFSLIYLNVSFLSYKP